MSKHDSWVHLKTPNLYEEIKHLFPHGFPVRDPFPMAYGRKENGDIVPLLHIDLDRLTSSQVSAITKQIATQNNCSAEEVLSEAIISNGFGLDGKWIERLEGGAECLQRTKEALAFSESNPNPETPEGQRAYAEFFADQQRRWIDGDETPPPLPLNIEEVDSELRTPELKTAIEKTRVERMLAQRGYSVMDVMLGEATEDILKELDQGSDITTIQLPEPTLGYHPPFGLPYNWRYEQGNLPAAIMAYLTYVVEEVEPPTPEQIKLIRSYLKHYINAPCWKTETMEQEFSSLRFKVDALFSVQDISDWISDCMNTGLDPL